MDNNQYMGQMPPFGQQQGYGQPMMQQPNLAAAQTTTNEELIEAIIEEKWNDLVKDIEKIAEWKTATESRLARIEQEIKDVKNSFDQLHQGILGKVGEYDKHILDVGTELKAMEKVFEKVLPLFTENVAALTHITQDFKSMMGVPVMPQVPPKKDEEKSEPRIIDSTGSTGKKIFE